MSASHPLRTPESGRTVELRPFSTGDFTIYPRCPRCGEGHHTDRSHRRASRLLRRAEHYVCRCSVCGQKWREAPPESADGGDRG